MKPRWTSLDRFGASSICLVCVYRPSVLPCIMSLLWHHHVSMLWHLLQFMQINCTKWCHTGNYAVLRFCKCPFPYIWKHLCPGMKGMSDKGPVPNGWSHSGSGEQWLIWLSQQDRLSLHFDNNSMCCVISCTFPASCCPCIAVMSATSVKLMWWVFFAVNLDSDSPFSLFFFSFNTADGNSYQVSISLFPLSYILVIVLPVCVCTLKRLIISKETFWSHMKVSLEIDTRDKIHHIHEHCTEETTLHTAVYEERCSKWTLYLSWVNTLQTCLSGDSQSF